MGCRSMSRLARSARGLRELAQSGGAIRLTDYQRALIQNDARFILLVQARQTGKSFGCSLSLDLDVVETELRGRSTAWAVRSRTQRQSKQVMAALRQHLEAFDVVFDEAEVDWGSDSDGRRQTSTEIRFPGGSKIVALPASPGGIRGLSGHAYFDEADIVPDFRELWASCSGIVTRGFRVLMSTTPMQTSGRVHQEMTAAESVWADTLALREGENAAQRLAEGPFTLDELQHRLLDVWHVAGLEDLALIFQVAPRAPFRAGLSHVGDPLRGNSWRFRLDVTVLVPCAHINDGWELCDAYLRAPGRAAFEAWLTRAFPPSCALFLATQSEGQTETFELLRLNLPRRT